MTVRRLVIDVLIPHHPSEVVYAKRISQLDGTEGVTVHLLEMDEKTKTVEMTIEGDALSLDAIRKSIEELGGSVHSVDRVSAGSRIVDSKAVGEQEG
jgi:hypothetical protein